MFPRPPGDGSFCYEAAPAPQVLPLLALLPRGAEECGALSAMLAAAELSPEVLGTHEGPWGYWFS